MMKLILSRKGFDTVRGGVPSPIFTSGTMVSLPIPSSKTNIPYSQVSKAGMNLGQIVNAIPGCKTTSGSPVHLDPDLEKNSLPRMTGWKPCFGQVGAAQGHLAKQGVKKGYLFLFFGLFRDVDVANITSAISGQIAYLRKSPEIHVLFGWLLVDDVIPLQSTPGHSPSWLAYHPHVIHQAFSPKNNTVYIAQKTLGSLDPSLAGIPGGGGFDKIIKPGLVLSDLTQRYFSVWKLPVWFMRPLGNPPMHLTYHPPVIPKSGRSRWTNLGNGFCQLRTVGRGQEFVLDCNNYGSQALSWALKILFLAKGNFR
jgi:hypothetical protein